MATRRIVASEKTVLEKDDTATEKSDISPAVPKYTFPSPETPDPHVAVY